MPQGARLTGRARPVQGHGALPRQPGAEAEQRPHAARLHRL